ncbi:NAD(P)/FAD-dependent oxidoreductase [Streptomyces sp. NPDC059680]|uniref:NAD(P)/FAD-dependent oxidoreductase n=1 Tax=Streptomyces sp. NPDC059680 TaxID=3346904 RepID=UPI00368D15BC
MLIDRTPRVAVIGAGPSGISAAYHLRDRAQITLYERDNRLGGHANTVEVEDDGRTLGLDTAFIVFNRLAYPTMTPVFDELGVEMVVHPGGFNFFDLDSGLEYGTRELGLGEEEVAARYAANPEFLPVWREVRRFHTEGRKDFLRGRADIPMGEYLDRGGYSAEFRHSYLILLCSAVWSVPAERIWEMPAATVIAFFMGHDEGGLGGRRVDWRTVGGGSISYVRKAIAAIGPEIRTGEPVTSVAQEADGVAVTTARGSERYDYAVLGAHADDSLTVLRHPTEQQRTVLSTVRYNASDVVLHTDASVISGNRERWESWNYGKVEVDGQARTYVVYYLNKLHDFVSQRDYFVTLDYPRELDREKVIARFRYTHPILDGAVRDLQHDIYRVNDGTRVKLCGSYFHSKKLGVDQIGSHEAAWASGKEAALQLLAELDG